MIRIHIAEFWLGGFGEMNGGTDVLIGGIGIVKVLIGGDIL